MMVLIVDDQELLRKSLRSFLQNAFPDFNLLEAADGASAIEACSTHRPQLILMDVCLPDANGIELITRVKSLLPDVRVIFISYKCGEAYVKRALAAGGWAYLCKDRLVTGLIPLVADATGRDPAKGHKRGLQ
ncbi:MAG: response regulator transcription factor [Burkholderiales bacterium]|nr:response regulator transcription factor [Burkholderiales bacterium]